MSGAAGSILQREHLAFDRPHRRAVLRRDAADAARPGAGRQHHDIGRDLHAVRQHHAVGAAVRDRNFLDRLVLVDGRAGGFGRDAQCSGKLAVVDLMVFRATTPRPRACRRDAARAGASRRRKSTPAAGRASSDTQGDDGGAPGRRRSARRPAFLRVRSSTSIPDAFSSSAAKAGQRAWLSRPSATRASSPGSASQQAASMPAAAWLAPLPAAPRSKTVDGRALGRQPPRNAKADHAGANDGDLGRFADACGT